MRTLKNDGPRMVRSVKTLDLRAYPQPSPVVTSRDSMTAISMVARTPDAAESNRQRFGRSLSMDRIETALQSAFRGSMSQITDILNETVDTDPHLGSILNKRFGSIAALPYQVQPATGYGIDREKAMFYAEVVRAQLRNLKSFGRNISQLAWALFNGRACLEKNWIQLPADVGPVHTSFGRPVLAVSDLDWIHPRRLTFGPQRELRIQPERATAGGNFAKTGLSVLEMPDKFIWWLPQLFNEYPEREGLGMRVMYWSFFKRFAARERMVLTELYGKPWRIVEVDSESQAGADELSAADKIVDNLGSTHTARMPRGTKLRVESPGKSAGEVHADVIAEADAQNSKLVLGQTGTTDGVPSGLNNNQANVMQDEQLGVLIRDAAMISEVIESQLTDRIIAINFGENEVMYAPTFRLRADLPADRQAELGRLKAALDAGLAISRTEAYEISGFSQPEPADIVLRLEQPPTPPNSPVAPAVRPVFVYPPGTTPDAGEQQLPPPVVGYEAGGDQLAGSAVGVTEALNTVTVNEDRQARGLGPLLTPEGSPDPRGLLTVVEFQALITKTYASPQPPQFPTEPAANDLGIAASRRNLTMIVPAPVPAESYDADDDVLYEAPFGDGGIHMHTVNRALESTGLDGRHYHVFQIDGVYVHTLIDGDHMHGLATPDENATLQDGEHTHSIVLPGGSAMVVTDVGSAHSHQLQIASSAVDGSHTHLLRIADPSNPAGYSEHRSLTAAELAKHIAAGTVPTTLFESIQNAADLSVLPMIVEARKQVQTTVQHIAEIRRTLAAQPKTSDGSPDDFVGKGLRELAAETSQWATVLENEVADQYSVFGVYNALARARAKLSVAKFGRTLERNKMHALMLGVIDSVHEMASVEDDVADQAALDQAAGSTTELGQALQQVGLTRVVLARICLADKKVPFTSQPFKSALETFKSLKLLDKPSFERATAAVKQRSFTVAGVVGDQMLQVLQADLFAAAKEGEDLTKFKARMRTRLQDSGFVAQLGELKNGKRALNASHIETVFRTNTLNTYNTGRFVHQTSPQVMAAFPVWQIVAVRDLRTRDTHRDAHGVMLLANDPFWQTAYPPFGWNCRCRVVPRTRKFLSEVRAGSTVVGLPDTGFTSGRTALATG